MASTLSNLNRLLPCRRGQIHQLHSLLEDSGLFLTVPDCIYVHGGPSAGKSIVVTSLLEGLEIKHAVINLIECYTAKILFESILNKLSGHRIDPDKGQPYARCDNLMEFIHHLKKCYDEADSELESCVIVLDKAEELRNMDANLLPAFLRLKEITGLPVCVLLISEITFCKYYSRTNVVEPIKIYFPQYTKEELLQILSLEMENAHSTISNIYNRTFDFDDKFYKTYLNLFLSVFHRACRDLSELRYMAKKNFIHYCKPVINKECDITDSMTLWRHISPILKSSLEVLYLRISTDNFFKNKDQKTTIIYSKQSLAQSLELPFYAKYLLIAAYLASYNPAKEDKRLFMKFHGKKKKTKKDLKNKCKVSELLHTQLGPKPFSFDRLLAIFYSILDEKVGFNNNLLVQVSSLVELQLLCSLSDSTSLDNQKYKCNVDFDFIQIFSKMVGFNIRKYLVDFN